MRPCLIILIVLPLCLFGNNLEISSLGLTGSDEIAFEISWDNSWNYTDSIAPFNHDGAWLFCKGRSRSDGRWRHIELSMSGHTAAIPLELRISNDGNGVLARRKLSGEGNITDANISLLLDVEDISSEFDAIRVYGIEMVFIPEGAFYVGDTASNNCLITYGSSDPYRIISDMEIPVGENTGDLWTKADYPPADNIPSSFPNGYGGIYTMKYEISQFQYAEFLNSLTPAQQASNVLSTIVEAPCFGSDHTDGERNFIVESDGIYGCDANGNGLTNEYDDGGETACNFFTWAQFTAYLDWSGLRPMTELEYEKICRGGEAPIPLEYAWGSPNIINTNYLADAGTDSEHVLDTIPLGFGSGNFGYCNPSGPLRCGFAGYGSTERLSSGASYYGVMEMSGNLWELCVVLTSGGLTYNGAHGDGEISQTGLEDTWNWPAGSGGHRGGAWNSGISPGFRDLAVSDRFFVYLDPDLLARGTSGGRGVITENRFE